MAAGGAYILRRHLLLVLCSASQAPVGDNSAVAGYHADGLLLVGSQHQGELVVEFLDRLKFSSELGNQITHVPELFVIEHEFLSNIVDVSFVLESLEKLGVFDSGSIFLLRSSFHVLQLIDLLLQFIHVLGAATNFLFQQNLRPFNHCYHFV